MACESHCKFFTFMRLFEYVLVLTYLGHRHFFALSDKKKVRDVVVESG